MRVYLNEFNHISLKFCGDTIRTTFPTTRTEQTICSKDGFVTFSKGKITHHNLKMELDEFVTFNSHIKAYTLNLKPNTPYLYLWKGNTFYYTSTIHRCILYLQPLKNRNIALFTFTFDEDEFDTKDTSEFSTDKENLEEFLYGISSEIVGKYIYTENDLTFANAIFNNTKKYIPFFCLEDEDIIDRYNNHMKFYKSFPRARNIKEVERFSFLNWGSKFTIVDVYRNKFIIKQPITIQFISPDLFSIYYERIVITKDIIQSLIIRNYLQFN